MIFGFILIMYWRKKSRNNGTYLTDLKETFRRGNTFIRLIYINVGIFVIGTLISVILQLFNLSATGIFDLFALPASLHRFILQPWSCSAICSCMQASCISCSICSGCTGSEVCFSISFRESIYGDCMYWEASAEDCST